MLGLITNPARVTAIVVRVISLLSLVDLMEYLLKLTNIGFHKLNIFINVQRYDFDLPMRANCKTSVRVVMALVQLEHGLISLAACRMLLQVFQF